MSEYEDFFTEQAIIKILCQERIKFCQKTHEHEFFERIFQNNKQNIKPEILTLFPPRSQWKRSRQDWRRKHQSNKESVNSKDLLFTVKKLRKSPTLENQSWIDRQNKLIESIRTKAFGDAISIANPKLIPVPKEKTNPVEHRLLASYSDNLIDSILLKQCGSYLRKKFDNYFLDCSFAFRAPAQQIPPTHHDAFKKLAHFWNANQKDHQVSAYVAECDIQGFYDIVDHQVVLKCYDFAVLELEKFNIEIDEQARKVICAYLDSYSYNQARLKKQQENSSINLKDRDETLKKLLYPEIKYGVPQGGALSVFFANLLLHQADVVVTDILKTNNNSATYVRYCDDMVIVTLDENLTNQAFEAYTKELEKLRLVHHPLQPSDNYAETFWKGKTKRYIWSDKEMPWLAFVGYHLRYDGMVRVRPSSLEKELKKQVKTQKRFLFKINEAKKNGKHLKLSKGELLAQLEGRLRASAIGKRPDKDLSCGMGISDFGWCKGFESLASENLPKSQPIARTQLRHLDRGLNKQLKIVKSKLKHNYQNPLPPTPPSLEFLGKPRSYAGQLESTE
jgi:hypothetical protein